MYHWENSNSNSKSSKSKYDPSYSSTFLDKFNKSLKTHPSKSHHNENITKTLTPKYYATNALHDDKMSTLRRASLVEKWKENKVGDKIIVSKNERKSNSISSSTLLEEFDSHDTFFSSSTTNTTTSSSSDETDYSLFSQHKHKTLVTCFAPPRPKPIKTHSIESKYIENFTQKNDDFIKNRSMAAKVYSNLKNLKQPVSPGLRLTSFINSLFTKEGKTNRSRNSSKVNKQRKTEKEKTTTTTSTTASYSTCSSASSFSRSCLMSKNNNKKKFQDDGIKRTVRFSPVSIIVDNDSKPCGYKSLQEDSESLLMNSKFKRSLSKRYEELKKLKGLEKEYDDMDVQHQKKLEEVAMDLLSGYWDSRLNKSHDLSSKIKDLNDGVNYAQHVNDDEDNDNDEDDDGFSCSSSDLFELDHLSLIGNELPVYETTKFDNKII